MLLIKLFKACAMESTLLEATVFSQSSGKLFFESVENWKYTGAYLLLSMSFCQIDPCFSASLLSTISPASTVAGKAVYKAKDMKFENPHTWHIWKAGRLYGWLGTQGGGRVMRQSICPPSLNGGSSRFCSSIWHVPPIKPHPVAYLPFLFFRLLFVAPIVASKVKKRRETLLATRRNKV